jgi:hypothetical protein
MNYFPGLSFFTPLANLHLRDSAEVWLQPGGAGTLAHADGYCSGVLSIQLQGVKRWRLMLPPAFANLPVDYFEDHDGGIYTYGSKFIPFAELEVGPGEAIFFPPGLIHETVSEGEHGCTLSVTALVRSPLPARFISDFLPGVSILGEGLKCMKKEWAAMATLSRKPDSFFERESAIEEILFDLIQNRTRIAEVDIFDYIWNTNHELIRSSDLLYLGFSLVKLRESEDLKKEIAGSLARDTYIFWGGTDIGYVTIDKIVASIRRFLLNLRRSRLVDAASKIAGPISLAEKLELVQDFVNRSFCTK